MVKLKGSKTADNILIAYSREMQVSTKYKYYSDIAKEEGYIEISEIFNKISLEELAHAKRYYELLNNEFKNEKIQVTTEYSIALSKSTEENLKAALLSENDVWRGIYPKFAEIARDEGFNNIATTFRLFGKAEKNHEEIFVKLYLDMKNDRLFKKDYAAKWICMNCGIIIEGNEPTELCPGCLYPKGYFKELNL